MCAWHHGSNEARSYSYSTGWSSGASTTDGYSTSTAWGIGCSNLIGGTCHLYDSGNCCLHHVGQDFDQIWPDNRLERFTTGPEFRAFKKLLKRAVSELTGEEFSMLRNSFEDALIDALKYR
jgi:hypothetical protein